MPFAENEPIAIIGTACRFPGDATCPSKLWELLRNPQDVQSIIPLDRFNPEGFYHKDNQHHGTSNVRHSYTLTEDIRRFDASFFGIKPIEANSIDPQQRLLMEVVYEALENSGQSIDGLSDSQTAVYVGLMCGDYADLLGRDVDDFPTYFATGTARSIVSNRISYFFNWHGPSMTIDTACSSSLVAVHQAVQTLRSGDSRVAVAAGANLLLGPESYIAESKLSMLSPDGRSRMWDVNANGYARGDGIAAVFLKTLRAAIEDGDRIEAIIRETGVNQDGHTKGITMPSATSQATLIRDVYKKVGLDLSKQADRPQYFEAHGTGTPAGDPIEAEAISTAFFSPETGYQPSPKLNDPLYVGSIKTVLGHTEGTAGLAALLKGLLAIKNQTIPPNMLLETLNPAVAPFYKNIEIVKKAKPWPDIPPGVPRRVSLNSFGFGGTNAHAILESYEPEQNSVGNVSVSMKPFVFSAASEKSLSSMLTAYLKFLEEHPAISLRDLSSTLSKGRSVFNNRISFSALSSDVLAQKIRTELENAAQNGSIGTKASRNSEKPRLIGVFTGQGAQWARMGAHLCDSWIASRSILTNLDLSLSTLPAEHRPSWSIIKELQADSKTSRINQAAISQPLCTAVQIMLVDLLRAAGISFAGVVGHSSGEIGAAYASGYVTAQDAIRIAYYRGLYLANAGTPSGQLGGMMAVGTSFNDAKSLCESRTFKGRICVAASNSSSSITLSGDIDALEQAKEIFDEEKKFARMLKVDKAYHSHHMEPCKEVYISALRSCGIRVQRPSSQMCTWVSSVYAEDVPEVDDDLDSVYWANNMTNPVLFSQALRVLVAEHGPFDGTLEVGPHPALKGPAVQTIEEVTDSIIPYLGLLSRGHNDVDAFTDALGMMWSNFGPSSVDFDRLDAFLNPGGQSPTHLNDLPNYCWDHDREFWHESRASKAFRSKGQPTHQLLGTLCNDNSEHQIRWRNLLRPKELPWLTGHQVQGQIVYPGAGYISAAVEAIMLLADDRPVEAIFIEDLVIGQALVFDGEEAGVETQFSLTNIVLGEERLTANFAFYSSGAKTSSNMSLNANGCIQAMLGADEARRGLSSAPEVDSGMMKVDDDRLYDALAELGFGYTGPFRALTSMQRKLGHAIGKIQDPAPADPESPLLVHPATLDAAVQSIILAYCFPGDTRLRSLHLPTKIQRICIYPERFRTNSGKEAQFRFSSTVGNNNDTDIDGDVDIFEPSGKNTMLRLEGLHTRALVHATPANDLKIFSRFYWDWGSPRVEVPTQNDTEKSMSVSEMAYTLERVAYFYLRHLDGIVSSDERQAAAWHHKRLFTFIDHTLSVVRSGKHAYGKKAWEADTHEQIDSLIDRYPESIDLRLMRAVGENMPAVIRGEITMLEPMIEGDMLNDFYVEGLEMPTYMNSLAQMVCQIGHRYPHMKILEIGAGTGGATKVILNQLGHTFSTYTFTDISGGFFGKARETFARYDSQMIFKTLNIEQDPLEQGFEEGHYDVIIASLVIHATRDLENSLQNVRRLIKPGGFLLLLEITNNDQMRFGFIFGGLEGWWLGYNDGRELSPCVTSAEWNAVMQRTGFTGVDIEKSPHKSLPIPFSVLVSQALDDRVQALREPLALTTMGSFKISNLTITGGTTSKVAALVSDLKIMLQPFCKRIDHIDNLEGLQGYEFPFMGSILALNDLDRPIFRQRSAEALRGFKKLFENSKSIVWFTLDCKGGNPFANMAVGIARTVILEMPHLRLQFADFMTDKDLNSKQIAETFLRHEITTAIQDDPVGRPLLWTSEPEVRIHEDAHLIPRLKLDQSRNDRYNAHRRHITKPITAADPWLELRYMAAEDTYAVHETDAFLADNDTNSRQRTIKTARSSLKAIKLSSKLFLHLLLGTDQATGETVFAFSRVARSVVTVSRTWSLPVRLTLSNDSTTLADMISHIVSGVIVAEAGPEGRLAILGATDEIAAIIAAHAEDAGVSCTFFDEIPTPLGTNTVISSDATIRQLRNILPKAGSRFLSFSSYGPLNQKIEAALCDSCHFEEASSMFRRKTTAGATESLNLSPMIKTAWSMLRQQSKPPGPASQPVLDINSQWPTMPSPNVSVVDWTHAKICNVQVEPVDAQRLFNSNKTYWLVGLTGGLGLSLCNWMIDHGASHIVVSSRNPRVDHTWLENMRSKGATIKVVANDITDRDSVRSTYEDICKTMPTIAGVAQGAMILQDAMFLDLDIEAFNKVVQPKVDGSIYLDEIFADIDLEFMVYFSSMASVNGNPGQSAYAAANMFMVAMANQRKMKGLNASAINIGAIIGNGYVTRELTLSQQTFLRKMGNLWMSEQDFHQIFAEALILGRERSTLMPEISTGLRLQFSSNEEKVAWFSNPIFQHLIAQDHQAQDEHSESTALIPIKTQLLAATTPTQVFEAIQVAFEHKIQTALQTEPGKMIMDLSADELGIDSLVAVDIRSWFLKEMKVDMPVLKILSGASVKELLSFAQSNISGELTPNLGADMSGVAQESAFKTTKTTASLTASLTTIQTSKREPPLDVAVATRPPLSIQLADVKKDYTKPKPKKLTTSVEPLTEAQPPLEIPAITKDTKAVSKLSQAGRRIASSPPSWKPPNRIPQAQIVQTNTDDRPSLMTSEPVRISKQLSRPSSVSDSSSSKEGGPSSQTSSSNEDSPLSPTNSTKENSTTNSRTSVFNTSEYEMTNPKNASRVHEHLTERQVPMSFGQSRFWFLRDVLADQTTFNITTSIKLEGEIDAKRLAVAVQTVGQHHEALRTRFASNEKDGPVQLIMAQTMLVLERKSISGPEAVRMEYENLQQHTYDLEKGEIMRIILLSWSAREHQLLLGYHHINMDGISFENFFMDLQKAYMGQRLSETAIQYPAFTVRQKTAYQKGLWVEQLRFWKEAFAEVPEPFPILPITAVTSRSPLLRYEAHRIESRISSDLSSMIELTCRKLKINTFNFYLAVFRSMLLRLSNTESICIGVADAHRQDGDVMESIGLFLNMFPILFTSQTSQSFSEVALNTKAMSQKAFTNSVVPFDILLSELSLPRSSTYSPLFQVLYNYRKGVAESRTFCDCDCVGQDYDFGRTAYDIALDVVDNPGGEVILMLSVQTTLYSKEAGEILMKSFCNLLETFAKNPAGRVSKAPLFNRADTQKAVDCARGPDHKFIWPDTLIHRIDDMGNANGSSTALKFKNTAMTYSAMYQRVYIIATKLINMNVTQCDRVGVHQDPSLEWACSLLAILRIGATYVPLDPRLEGPRLKTIAADCKLRLILHDAANAEAAKGISQGADCLDVNKIQNSAPVVTVANKARPESIAAILYTSGSTGVPKGIALSHACFSRNIELSATQWNFTSADTNMQQSAYSFDMSLSQTLLALSSGGTLLIIPKEARGDPWEISNIIQSGNVTFTEATPSEYIAWISDGNADALRRSKWSKAVSGGEKATGHFVETLRRLDKSGLIVHDCYGPTEVTFCSNSSAINYSGVPELQTGLKTWPSYSTYILDDAQRALPMTAVGEIYIGGSGVTSGYIDEEKLTKQRFLHDPYASTYAQENGWTIMHRTGDRGFLNHDGSLTITGRIDGDTQVKLNGQRLNLSEIEEALLQASEKRFTQVAISLRKASNADILVAFVRLASKLDTERHQTLTQEVLPKMKLPTFMRPSIIIVVSQLPHNAAGKLDRRKLDELPLSPESFQAHPPSKNEHVDKIRSLWLRVLDNDIASNSLTSQSDFFHIGGSSLLLGKLQKAFREEMGASIPLTELFEHSTFERMASRVTEALGESSVTQELTKASVQEQARPTSNTTQAQVSTPSKTNEKDTTAAPSLASIDWEAETQLQPNLATFDQSKARHRASKPRNIILTGASGFLGRAILRQLKKDKTVAQIHCIAMRKSPDELPSMLFKHDKIKIHRGDLKLSRLGLSSEEAVGIFSGAAALIHNGAEVSFLKSYGTLRKTNVQATMEVIALALQFSVPVHYVSSATVGRLIGRPSFGEVSVANTPPPIDGSEGYMAAKWASERLLEKAAAKYGLQAAVHRPSIITGDDAPPLDLMANVIKYSRQMRIVPIAPGWSGYFDYVSVRRVATGICAQLNRPVTNMSGIHYTLQSGELEIPLLRFEQVMQAQHGTRFLSLPMVEWVEKARGLGLDEMVGIYLKSAATVPIVFPRLMKAGV